MMNQSLFLLSAGGLFDFGATLPFVALQFLALMFFLNSILYTPLLNKIDERNNYILNNLTESSSLLAQVDEFTAKYETELSERQKVSKMEIKNAQQNFKEIVNENLSLVDKVTNSYVSSMTTRILDESYALLFKEEKKTGKESYIFSSQIFYKLAFPYYKLK
jgi:hypothetical protein